MDFTRPTRGPVTRQRAAGVAAVVLIHFVLVGLLLRLEQRVAAPPEPPVLQLDLLKPPPPIPVEMPSISPRLRPPPPPNVPPPSLVVAEPVAPVAPIAIVAPAAPAMRSGAGAVSAGPTAPTLPDGLAGSSIGDIGTAGMVRAKMDMTRSPNDCHNPPFPPDEDRNAYGLAAVSLLIDSDGRVRGSRIDATSGHSQLDRATIDAFARCTYIRGTIRGLPAPTWYRIKWLWFLPRNQR